MQFINTMQAYNKIQQLQRMGWNIQKQGLFYVAKNYNHFTKAYTIDKLYTKILKNYN